MAVAAEAEVAVKEVKAVAEVTAEVENAEVGSVIVRRESAMTMVAKVDVEAMEDLEVQVLDMSGMEIMLSQHTLVLVEVEEQAGKAAVLEEVVVEVMAEMVEMVVDLSQMVLEEIQVKTAVKAVVTSKVADTEVIAAVVVEAEAEEAEATLVKYPTPTMVV